MRILVVGSGGREHALVRVLKRSARVTHVACAPGNGGIARDAVCIPLAASDNAGILDAVRSRRIDLVVIGPEAPLAAGLADYLEANGVAVVGPQQAAARLESSKVFAKQFMERHSIPTAAFRVCETADAALAVIESWATGYPLVVKADGLAAGKGVVVARNAGEARDAVHRIMVEREFGAAGDLVVVEECLGGLEASFIVFTDGKTVVPAVAARDHKAVYDNDEGPNTGGMGAFSTDTILGPETERYVLEKVVHPVVEGMRTEGCPFKGMLYAGLMLTGDGPKVLEFNVRMGDPEGQVILPRLESDFATLCEGIAAGRLAEYRPVWSTKAAVCVVLASSGYPGAYARGRSITGVEMAEENPNVMVFHAGTRRVGADLLTDGGRVLGVTAMGTDLQAAIIAAYGAINKIHFDGMHYRRDIGITGLHAADK